MSSVNGESTLVLQGTQQEASPEQLPRVEDTATVGLFVTPPQDPP